MNATIIPAQPGYFVVTKSLGGGYWPDPVLAWSIREFHAGLVCAFPVTLDGGTQDECAVLRPDGRVSLGTGERVWDTLADWLSDEAAR